MTNITQPLIVSLARSGEPDHYLAALLATDKVRHGLLAIAAYSAEISNISNVVREPMMGEIRLQWWRERLQAREAAGHDVLQALEQVRGDFNLSLPLLLSVTEARAFDLYTDPMPDEASFHGYIDKISGSLFALGLALTAPAAPMPLAIHAGRAYGAARLLADLPRRLACGRDPLPQSWLIDAERSHVDRARLTLPARRATIERVIGVIDQDLATARRLAQGMTRRERVPLLPLATIRPYLAAIQKAVATQTVVGDIVPLERILRIARAHWFGL